MSTHQREGAPSPAQLRLWGDRFMLFTVAAPLLCIALFSWGSTASYRRVAWSEMMHLTLAPAALGVLVIVVALCGVGGIACLVGGRRHDSRRLWRQGIFGLVVYVVLTYLSLYSLSEHSIAEFALLPERPVLRRV